MGIRERILDRLKNGNSISSDKTIIKYCFNCKFFVNRNVGWCYRNYFDSTTSDCFIPHNGNQPPGFVRIDPDLLLEKYL